MKVHCKQYSIKEVYIFKLVKNSIRCWKNKVRIVTYWRSMWQEFGTKTSSSWATEHDHCNQWFKTTWYCPLLSKWAPQSTPCGTRSFWTTGHSDHAFTRRMTGASHHLGFTSESSLRFSRFLLDPNILSGLCIPSGESSGSARPLVQIDQTPSLLHR